jgi:hypothetical protein
VEEAYNRILLARGGGSSSSQVAEALLSGGAQLSGIVNRAYPVDFNPVVAKPKIGRYREDHVAGTNIRGNIWPEKIYSETVRVPTPKPDWTDRAAGRVARAQISSILWAGTTPRGR